MLVKKGVNNKDHAERLLNTILFNINKFNLHNKIDESTGEKVNPYLAFINDAANNMTPHDRSGLRNLD